MSGASDPYECGLQDGLAVARGWKDLLLEVQPIIASRLDSMERIGATAEAKISMRHLLEKITAAISKSIK